jgi:transcriptional regulator with PAS, ATPase and Fis domain
MTRRAVGDEAAHLLPEVEQWIKTHLPRDYHWPGNYRELEQCVRNVVIRQSYRPMEPRQSESAEEVFFSNYRAGRLKLAEVVSHYVAQVYRQTGTYEEAAQILELDRRTVKTKVQEYLSQHGIEG